MTFLRNLLMISVVSLGVFQACQAWHENKEDLHHFHQLYKAANGGDIQAKYELAVILLHGLNGSKDEIEALRWFRAAAEEGHSGAQYYMGEIYQYGQADRVKDEAKALSWYQLAADQGHLLAQTMIKHLSEQKLKASTPQEGDQK